MAFGRRLAQVRAARGWSLQELADRSGVPYITIRSSVAERYNHFTQAVLI